MHANRNKSAVKRVEKGMMKANRTRNLFAVFAIILTTFMITHNEEIAQMADRTIRIEDGKVVSGGVRYAR